MKKILFASITILIPLLACHEQPSAQNTLVPKEMTSDTIKVSYNFDQFDEVFVLDRVLEEISGLSYCEDTHTLITHNDEKGIFFILDITNGKIIDHHKFAKSGDYESIQCLPENIYVANSTGHLYRIDRSKPDRSEEQNTILSEKNNVEGLCYDKENNQLLLACKDKLLENKKKNKNRKAIYAYDLANQSIIPKPVLTISRNKLTTWLEKNYIPRSNKDFKKKKDRVKDFSPSGICYNYNQSELYLLSAKGGTLVVFDKALKLSQIHFLNPNTIPQPEGICFDKEDNLYLSTEGQGHSGKIFKFSPN